MHFSNYVVFHAHYTIHDKMYLSSFDLKPVFQQKICFSDGWKCHFGDLWQPYQTNSRCTPLHRGWCSTQIATNLIHTYNCTNSNLSSRMLFGYGMFGKFCVYMYGVT